MTVTELRSQPLLPFPQPMPATEQMSGQADADDGRAAEKPGDTAGIIRTLPENLVNRIRAGEIVESPAQIVKELVENALDAGAEEIRVVFEGGGKVAIVVEDNGAGMSSADLVLSVERHTTSKLPTDSLADIATLGFRGEALAAIGAVARLSIASRRLQDDCSWQVEVENGVKKPLRPVGGKPGTRVEVRDLFRAHPVRMAFLKADRYEKAVALEAFQFLALTHPDVAFSFDAGKGARLSYRPEPMDARIHTVMGNGFHENSAKLDASAPGIALKGRIALPTWPGHTASNQYLIVNGRSVRDRTISSALREAFALVSKERTPAAVLFLDIDPAKIDVNVHPSKAEIRFADPATVAKFVQDAVASAIGAQGPRAASALSSMASEAARIVETVPELRDPRSLPLGKPMGVVLGNYIVSETAHGLILIDAHAGAERVTLERLKQAALADGVSSKKLSQPLTVEVGMRAAAIVDEHHEELARLGLELQALDGGAILVLGIPEPLYGSDAVTLVREVVAALIENQQGNPLLYQLDRLCSLLACHASFRSGDAMSQDEMHGLLRLKETTPNSAQCNHGRPTAIAFDQKQIEKLFARR